METSKSLNSRASFFILLCLCMEWPSTVHAQRDTLKPGEMLGFSEKLSSADGRFILGFFNPLNAAHRYLGIWYKDDSDDVVWVAGRTSPVYGNTGSLTMDADGALKILQSGGNTIELNSDHSAKNSTATLQNSGNFVITELNPDGSVKGDLWQSFDHPTNTLLPGMKLGLNWKTGQAWKLTSWLSPQIAAPGTFSLEWNSSGSDTGQLVARRRGEIYWRSGSLNLSNQTFENVPRITGYNFSFISNENESYVTYSVSDGSSTSRLVLDDKGAIENFLSDSVCKRVPGCLMPEPVCKSQDDTFTPTLGVFVELPYWTDNNLSIGLGDCWRRCWNECSCVGYDTLNTDGTGCQLWNVNFTNAEYDGRMRYVLNSIVPPSSNDASGNGLKWWLWIIIALAPVLLIFIWGFLRYLRRKKLQADKERSEEVILLKLIANDTKEDGIDGKKSHDLKVFSFASVMAATNDFSSQNKLGEGGFGPVYKGKLPEGQEIAVKRLSTSSGQGLVEFKNELLLIAKLQHMNLVRLLGCCVKGDEKMLIYEFMPNKSLDFFLFDPTGRKLLNWERRCNIIDGIAQGLLYLHKYSRLRIIHRDLKASNILLDDDMNPKISDFGMARIFGRHESEANTNRVVGTYGYMSPEYAMEGNFSEKSDVYSFGVLLLEIVSGRKNSAIYQDFDRPLNLVGFAWQLWREGRILELMDPTLSDSCDGSQVQRCMHVGLLCIQEYAVDRPTMADVISMLFNKTVPLPAPKRTANNAQQELMEDGEQETCSIGLSAVSEMEAR